MDLNLKNYKAFYSSNIKLALPVIISQAGQTVVGLVDNVMVGRVGTAPLAAASFANSIFIIILVFGIGFSYAITPLVAKAIGKGDERSAVHWFHQGLRVNIFIGIFLVLASAVVAYFMPYMGQPEDVVELGVPYFLVISVSILPFLHFASYKQFAEGISNTRLAMIITISGNIVNVIFNYLLIYGKAGFPELGLLGAGIGTLISRIFMSAAFLIIYRRLKFFARFRQIQEQVSFSFKEAVHLVKLGGPMGMQLIIEVFAFSLGAIMMGWLGEDPLAAHQIVITVASLTFMMSSGLASATTIKVSTFRGKNDFRKLKYSAFASIHMVIAFMSITAVIFLLTRHLIPELFIKDENVVSIAAGLFLIAAVFQIFDGLQVVMIGVLRGMEDVVFPMIVIAVAYLFVSIPIGYVLSFIFELGPQGIWIGYLSGLSTVSLVLLYRFRQLYLKHERG
jgi:MATE family multidrug resistance protein